MAATSSVDAGSCTSTGTLRRHPDVAWLRRPTDVRALAELQSKLVAAAAALLKPGAPLLYAVCSLEPEEGERQAAVFLDTHSDFAVSAIDNGVLPDGITANDGQVRTLSGMLADQGGLDGFFVASFTRTA